MLLHPHWRGHAGVEREKLGPQRSFCLQFALSTAWAGARLRTLQLWRPGDRGSWRPLAFPSHRDGPRGATGDLGTAHFSTAGFLEMMRAQRYMVTTKETAGTV